ncbi:MAG: hypothetical protein ABJB86_12215 [Bacteroidota bacterium]
MNQLPGGTNKNTICFTLIVDNTAFRIQIFLHQYHSLMTLISEYTGKPGFGICSGMGSCGTCRVDICGTFTLNSKSVLSCDTMIEDELSGITVIVPERYD